MTKLDPIIAVKDVDLSSEWYQKIFECRRTHGGSDFAVLLLEDDEVLICLHKWGEHNHPTMMDSSIQPGNGLILYFKSENIDKILTNARNANCLIEEEMHLNPNSTKREFSLRDPDGYYWTVTEYHNYEG